MLNCLTLTLYNYVLQITMVTRRYPNLHVLHLVRHPGALIHSRFLFPFVSQFESVSNTTVCTRLHNDVKGQSQGQAELNAFGWHTSSGHHYMRLRYEDMVTSLPQTASAIYRFMGKQTPPNMLAWIQSRSTSKGIHLFTLFWYI